ncbi:Hypothetical Protein RRSL_04656 [Ralstonia solanacearum UW551]|uniref:Uncharacterized protein n=1 Tax=Ralstonia solanacearum (strain UW551) TaxID=342110 RepID=A0AB33VIW9_RALSU|nr:Hypothetical Protein RRSL_04656 [Ralstonia solanacearum UW551]
MPAQWARQPEGRATLTVRAPRPACRCTREFSGRRPKPRVTARAIGQTTRGHSYPNVTAASSMKTTSLGDGSVRGMARVMRYRLPKKGQVVPEDDWYRRTRKQ